MFSSVQPKDYREIKDAHQTAIPQFPLIDAVVSRVQDGFVYASPSMDSVFISTKSGFSLLSTIGNTSSDFAETLFEFLKANREIPDYIHIYRPPGWFLEHLTANWDQHKIRRRAQFRNYEKAPTFNYESLLSPEYRIAAIQDLGCARLEKAFQLDFGRRYWNSEEDFVTHAVGACIVNDEDEPVAICYSACVVDGIAEMDTLVLPEYRGQRFMRIVSEPFFNLTKEKGLTPHWDTFISNSASYVMAQKFELELIQEYDLLSVLLR